MKHEKSGPGILIADDMALILTLLKLDLEARGFTVWLAVNGADAVQLYQQHQENIDLVLLDVHMPALDGPQTLAALQEMDPDVVACFMTAYSECYSECDLLKLGAACVFTKPFRSSEVADFLQVLCSGAGRACELASAAPVAMPAAFSY